MKTEMNVIQIFTYTICVFICMFLNSHVPENNFIFRYFLLTFYGRAQSPLSHHLHSFFSVFLSVFFDNVIVILIKKSLNICSMESNLIAIALGTMQIFIE